MESYKQLLFNSFSFITFNKAVYFVIACQTIPVSSSENELAVPPKQEISFNNGNKISPRIEDFYEGNSQISATIPEQNTTILANISKITTRMKHSDSHIFDEVNTEGDVLFPITKLERKVQDLNSQNLNSFLEFNENPLKLNRILVRREYESKPRGSAKEWQTSYSIFGPHNYSFVKLVPNQDIKENVSPTVKEVVGQSKTSNKPANIKFVQTNPFYFTTDHDSSEFRNMYNKTLTESEMEVTSMNEVINNETSIRNIHPLQLNFSMEAILKIIKRERNIQIKILNELVLYLPVLFCDILLLVACWKLLHHIFQQISVRDQPQPLGKDFEDYHESGGRKIDSIHTPYSRAGKRFNYAESNTPGQYVLTNEPPFYVDR